MPSKILVTGASGFIGTNLIESLRHKGHEVVNIDVCAPRHPRHRDYFRKVDILDRDALQRALRDFTPNHVVHLAARTDLDETVGLEGYRANTDGVQNIVDAILNQPSVQRAVFASTKLVCPTDTKVQNDDDYRPDTVYGESKVRGEKIVKREWLSAEGGMVHRSPYVDLGSMV